MSSQSMKPLEYTKKESTLEHENFYKIALNKQYMDVQRWKLKVEMVLNMTNKEIQKNNAKKIELKNLQDKVHKNMIESCNFIHDLMKNSWMANLGNNLGCLTLINTETVKNKTNNSFVLNKLEEELNEIKSILEALNFKRQQDKKLNELISKINNIEHSITIWNEETLKIELGLSKSKNE